MPHRLFSPRVAVGSVVLASCAALFVSRSLPRSLPATAHGAPRPAAALPTAASAPETAGSPAQRDANPSSATATNAGAMGFDVERIVDRVHFAFEADGAGYRGGHETYGSRVDASGTVSVQPVAPHAEASPATRARKPEALRLKTASVARVSAPRLGTAAAAVVTSDNGAATAEPVGVVIHRGAVDEHVRNTADGVAQSWSFAERPTGGGDLVVRVHPDGLPLVGETANGLHFAGRDGVGVRYGNATWIDARGERVAVRATYTHGDIELRVPAAAVDASAFPAVLDPVIGPETGVDVAAQGATQRIYGPRIASGAGVFLVAWRQLRAYGAASFDVRAARVRAADGVLLDPTGIDLGVTESTEDSVDVGFAQSQFFAAWRRYTPSAPAGTAYEARVARIAPGTGQVLDPGGRIVNANVASPGVNSLALAASDRGVIIAWSDTQGAVARRLDAGTGTPILTPLMRLPAPVGATTVNRRALRITQGDAYDAVFWIAVSPAAPYTYQLGGARIRRSDDALFPLAAPIDLVSSLSYLEATSSGSKHVVVTSSPSTTGGTGREVALRAFDDATGAAAPTVLLDQASSSSSAPVACEGDACVALWSRPAAVGTGATLVAQSFSAATGARSSAVTTLFNDAGFRDTGVALANGTLYTALLGRTDAYPLRGARVRTSDLAPLDATPTVLSHEAGVQTRVALASLQASPSQYLLAWSDTRGDSGELRAVRLDATGTMLDPSALVLASAAPSAALSTAARVAGGASRFAVVWPEDGGGLVARSVDATTGALSPRVQILAHGQGYGLDVAASGNSAVVAWNDGVSTASICAVSVFDMQAATVTASSSVPQITGTWSTSFAVAGSSAGLDLITGETSLGSSPGTTYLARRISSTGTVGLSSLLYGSGTMGPLRAASNGAVGIVGWSCGAGVCAFRYDDATLGPLGASSTPLPAPPAASSLTASLPSFATDGRTAYVVWQTTGSAPVKPQIVGSRMRLSDGATLDAAGFVVASDTSINSLPVVACAHESSCFVSYGHAEGAGVTITQRVFKRELTDAALALGVACGVAEDCASGSCVDGVCCSSACGGGRADDCMACDVPGSVGTCAAVPATRAIVCRAAAGDCDTAETCTGASTACPADGFAAAGHACADDGELCTRDACDGAGACAHTPGNAGATCRSAVGECDVAEVCTGTTSSCPVDGHRASGFVCRAPTCLGGVAASSGVCDGQTGACPAAVAQSCAPFTCGATACAGDCAHDGDCTTGAFCSLGVCKPLHTTGVSCGGVNECATGNCVDGVCCDSACNGACNSCNLPGRAGTCSTLAMGTVCAPATCTGGAGTPALTCSGFSGECLPKSSLGCAPYVCDGTSCGTSCVGDAQCVAGKACIHGACVAPPIDAGPPAGPDAGPHAPADAGPDTTPVDPSQPPPVEDAGHPTYTKVVDGVGPCSFSPARSHGNGAPAGVAFAFAGIALALVRRRRRAA